jgi:hypothetical protein
MVVVLIHSPLVGPYTWSLVADELNGRGITTVIPTLRDQDEAKRPYWQQHARAVAQSVDGLAEDVPLVLVGHSGAGPLLPAIRWAIGRPVAAYLFVDAGIAHDGASRLQLMREESAEWADQFHQFLKTGGSFPNWYEQDLADVIPDAERRQRLMAELQPRSLHFFTEPITVFHGWPDAPGGYLLFTPTYNVPAEQARRLGWPVLSLAAGHFHMLVDPPAVAAALLQLWEQLHDS